MAHKHTFDHFKTELSTTRLLNRQPIDAWKAAGSPTMEERVKEEVRKIVESHTPEPLDDKVISELERLKIEGEKEILKKAEKG